MVTGRVCTIVRMVWPRLHVLDVAHVLDLHVCWT